MSKRREMARLQHAAEAGDMDAANDLAGLLHNGGDVAGAERWMRRAAEAGDIGGMINLARVLCMQQRFAEAEPWIRKGLAHPRREEARPGFCEALLGNCLVGLGKFEEAEQWLTKGAAAGIDSAVEDLQKLRKGRAEGTRGSTTNASGTGVLNTFDVGSIMFYDGVGHRLGAAVCTLTRDRFIIDAGGGISQFRLRDITSVSVPGPIASPKMVRITAPGVAYDIYCRTKDQRYDLEAWLSEAIRTAY